ESQSSLASRRRSTSSSRGHLARAPSRLQAGRSARSSPRASLELLQSSWRLDGFGDEVVTPTELGGVWAKAAAAASGRALTSQELDLVAAAVENTFDLLDVGESGTISVSGSGSTRPCSSCSRPGRRPRRR
ncbi:unnamed protein product, partial [Prorocentrum cordatum]